MKTIFSMKAMVIGLALALVSSVAGEPPETSTDPKPGQSAPWRPSIFDIEPPRTSLDMTDVVFAQFPIATDGDCLLVPVKIGQKEYLFVVDTGASATVIDRSLLPEKPTRTETLQSPDGMVELPFFTAPQASLGILALQTNPEVVAMDLARFREISGSEIFGFIGMDFLRHWAVRIDFDKGKLSLLEKVSNDSSGHPVPIYWNQFGLPCVDLGLVGSNPNRFLLDTGCVGFGTGDMTTSLIDELEKAKKATRARNIKSISAAGERGSRQVRVVELALDNLHRNLNFREAQWNSLGLSFLSRYEVTLDFRSSKMYLKKGKRFDLPENEDLSGLTFLRREGNVVVDSVEEGSPAALGGIEPKDVLLAIDGKPTQGERLFPLRNRLCTEGHRVSIRIQRGREKRDVSFVLHDWQIASKP